MQPLAEYLVVKVALLLGSLLGDHSKNKRYTIEQTILKLLKHHFSLINYDLISMMRQVG